MAIFRDKVAENERKILTFLNRIKWASVNRELDNCFYAFDIFVPLKETLGGGRGYNYGVTCYSMKPTLIELLQQQTYNDWQWKYGRFELQMKFFVLGLIVFNNLQ